MASISVTSADGTQISAQSNGTGRALVLVSGALFFSERWLKVVPLVSEQRSVILLDRRGRGKSGSGAAYSPEREVEDISAVLDSIAGPVDLLGHSSGAILALQVAQRSRRNLERLIAYEPPVFFSVEDRIAPDLPERLEALLAAGKRDEAVETFLREGPRSPEADLRDLKASPIWAPLVQGLGHTVPYDAHVQRSYSADPAELARVRIPTLMLLGGSSPSRMRVGTETVAARLPNATLTELPGQQHVAMLSAPAQFADAVNGFLSQPIASR
ncbi:MAG TPA: alpha/beta hydrolase [Polyangiaceae bacterium]|nr:alpha/beta hydrolase [Polyangiaceae bacterium]